MDCIIIGIAGGTGSGISTFTNRLKQHFGDGITIIYHDNYYKRHDEIPFEERKKLNYDTPEALESELLTSHLKDLKNGKSIKCPIYDFSKHNRSDKFVEVKPSRIIIVEGILVLADEQLRNQFDVKIFVDSDADERSLRRARRDMRERGRDIDNIIEQYVTTVKPMHYLYVEPTKYLADIVINGGHDEVAFDLVVSLVEGLTTGEDLPDNICQGKPFRTESEKVIFDRIRENRQTQRTQLKQNQWGIIPVRISRPCLISIVIIIAVMIVVLIIARLC